MICSRQCVADAMRAGFGRAIAGALVLALGVFAGEPAWAAAVEDVEFDSFSGRDQTYAVGDDIEVAVGFDEVVHVDETESELVLVLSIGEHSRSATFVSGSGTATLTFRYTVRSGDYDDDGMSIGPGISRDEGSLPGGRIRDADGALARRNFSGVGANENQKVDGISPTPTEVTIISVPIQGAIYHLGEDIEVEVTFDEIVHVNETVSELVLALSIGEHSRAARFVAGSGTDTLTFRYTVQAGDSDGDGVSISAGVGALQGARIEDFAGNAVVRTFPGLAADSNHKVDGVSPSLTAVRIVSTPDANATYGLNEEIRVEVDFGEEVHVTGDLTLTLSIGENSRAATFVGGSGTDTLTFGYVVGSDDYDSDGISIGPTALRGGVVEDAAGNAVDRTFAGLAAASGHKVDGVGPALTRVEIVSTTGTSGFYGLNEEIRVEVEFGEEVHVTGDLSLVLSIGEHLRAATLAGGSGTDTLTFRYAVQSGDSDDDGISIGPTALRGGVVEDAAGNAVDRTFAGLAAASGHKVDGVGPALTRVEIVSTTGPSGFYGLNEEIRVEVEFGEEVHVTGDLSLVLSIGEHLRAATLAGGSGTDTLTFRYAVQSGDSDDDGISIGPSALQGGGIEDAAGNAVDRTFAGLAAASGHKVDGVGPALTRVEIVSTTDTSGFYGLNEEIRIEVDFGEEVHVTGDLSLVLSIGEHLRAATLAGGSGTDTLTFRYAVQSGDSDDDGISIGPSALQGGGIADAAGNAVDRTFAGLAAASGHKVDGVGPALTRVEIVSTTDTSGFYGLNEEIRVEVAFGEVVHVTDSVGNLALILSIGEHLRAATFDGGSGTDTLSFLYVVQAGDMDDDGISIGPNALQGGAIVDTAGNEVVRDFAGLPIDGAHKVNSMTETDAPPPIDPTLVATVSDVTFYSEAGSNDTYSTGDMIIVDVIFSNLVYVTGELPVLELSIGSMLRDALFVEGSGSRTLRFQYVVEAGDTDDDGISIGPNALVGNVEDGSGNAVDLTLPAKPANASHKVSAELMLYPLALTLVVGQTQTINLADQLMDMGVTYRGEFEMPSDDSSVVTAKLSDDGMLTITSVLEGTATIIVKAMDAAIYLFFGVTVETSAAETSVLEDAMAAVGRGLLASAGSTIGARLEMTDASSSDDWGERGMAPVSVAASPGWSALDGADHWGSPLGYGSGMDDPYLQASMEYTPGAVAPGRPVSDATQGFRQSREFVGRLGRGRLARVRGRTRRWPL